jgi:hypothetical protein
VSIDKTRIYLQGIAELDGSLAVFALLVIALSTLEVLLLADVRIT